MNEYLARLYKQSPYDGFDASRWPSDVHGWNDHSAEFSALGRDAKLVIELGAWKGRSTIALARACPNAIVLSIDTWLGAKEMWTNKDDPDRYGALRLRNGYPQLVYEFMANMVRAGIQNRVVPMPMTTAIGLDLLKDWGVRPDLIFVDASHTYEDVRADISGALKLSPRVLCGDDLSPGWPGVVKAVGEMVPNHRSNGNYFWWSEY